MWLARYVQNKRKCPQCGSDPDVCGDAEKPWYPQRTICYQTMETRAANAQYAALHEDAEYHDGSFRNWAKERSRWTPYRFDEGVKVWAAPVDLSPDDDFLAAPRPHAETDSPAEQ